MRRLFDASVTSALALGLWLASATPTSAQAPTLEFLRVPARPPTAARSGRDPRPRRELQRELERFDRDAQDYRATTEALLRRRARERQRAILGRYASSIDAERRSQRAASAAAIQELQRFVVEHPDEPRYTPTALLRLAELRLEHAGAAAGDEPPDLSGVIEAAGRAATQFPESPLHDRAGYLHGWALQQSGQTAEAVDAWLGVVCADRASPPAGSASAPHASASRYPSCHPSSSPLEAQLWLRIGEAHFDAAQLPDAIEAYAHVVQHPEDPLFSLGLYKLAWSLYRAGRYAEAIARFSQVIRYSDGARERSSGARTGLREDSIQYIALTLAYDDWDEDGRPDHTQGGPHPLERLEDDTLWVQDQPWSPEIYRRVGEALFEQGHVDEAIVAWQLRLSAYPADCGTPGVYRALERAHRQRGDDDALLRTISELAGLVRRDGEWVTRVCPGSARRAARLAEEAAIALAVRRHQRAQALRARARVDGDAHSMRVALAEYGAAITRYRQYLETYPDRPSAYELTYNLADALFFSERYLEAALTYAQVRDSPVDSEFRQEAARRVVASLIASMGHSPYEEIVHTPRDRPSEIPEMWRRVARAREIYVRWYGMRSDWDRGAGYARDNAALLLAYGFRAEANRRYLTLLRAYCRGPRAGPMGYDALEALLHDAFRRDDAAAAARLSREVRARRCTFSADGPPIARDPCERADPLCLDLETADFVQLTRSAQALSSAPPSTARSRETLRIAGELAAMATRRAPHPNAPAALLLAASLYRGADHLGEAVELLRRIVERYPAALRGPVARTDDAVIRVLGEAHFQLGLVATERHDLSGALTRYETLLESQRFRRCGALTETRRDATVNSALLMTRLGRHRAASRRWVRAARMLSGGLAREALLHAAEETLRAGDARLAATRLDAWLRSGPATVQAQALRARTAEALGDERGRRRALTAALRLFNTSPSAADRPIAAHAALALARAFERATPAPPIAPGRRATVAALLTELRAQVAQRTERTLAIVQRYDAVVSVGQPRPSVAALRHQGLAYDSLVHAVLDARLELPRDLRRRIRRAPHRARALLREELQDRLRDHLEGEVRPVECRAIERFTLSVRLARRAALPLAAAREARDRLRGYGAERVTSCLDAAHARDPSFAPFSSSLLEAPRPRLHSPPDASGAPPTLAR